MLCVSGDLADLIFVFFDPIGQALCKRTLNLVERLNERHAERMRFYLSKADEAGRSLSRSTRFSVRLHSAWPIGSKKTKIRSARSPETHSKVA